MSRARLGAAVVLAAAALAGCGGAKPTTAEPSAPLTLSTRTPSTATLLSSSALPGMRATTSRLTASDVVQATPIKGLGDRLRTWGLRGVAAREFTGVGGPLVHVVSRTAVFATPAGAAGYVRALVANRDAYLGDGAGLTRMAGGYLIREAACGCHPTPPTLIALRRDGMHVRWLSISGRAADVARARALATHLQ